MVWWYFVLTWQCLAADSSPLLLQKNIHLADRQLSRWFERIKFGWCMMIHKHQKTCLQLVSVSFDNINLRSTKHQQMGALVPRRTHRSDLAGKSVYLVMIDRFAREGGLSHDNAEPCGGERWCNGTLKGITKHLDYISGMGWDCIWVTPVVKNFYGPDLGQSGYGYHGYWTEDFTEIDPHFGTAEDLRELVQETHKHGSLGQPGVCCILHGPPKPKRSKRAGLDMSISRPPLSVSESEQPQTLDHEMLTVGFHWSSWHKPTTDHRAPFCHVRVELTPLRYVVKQLTWVIAGIFDTGCVASLIGDINNYWFGTIPYPHWSLPLSEPREPVAPGCYQHW